MNRPYPAQRIFTILVFIGCLCLGFWIARHKPLWNDEYYSEKASVHGTSFADQFSGHMPKGEGNNAPLFYVLQKLFLQFVHYQMPSLWLQGHWYNDATSQIFLRITSIVFMSLSVSLVFYYFCRRHSWAIALISLFIYLSSHMFWVYCAEARPYALWVLLTTVQSMLFLKMMEESPRTTTDGLWIMLVGTNILLSLTSFLSIGEILAMSLLWWVFKERDLKKYILLTVLPVAITVFYHLHAITLQFYFSLSPEQLIRDNIPRESFDILIIFLVLLAVSGIQKIRFPKNAIGEGLLESFPYVIYLGLVLASGAAVLGLLAMHATNTQGFPITSRYFIYLMPVGVIATTLLIDSIVKSLNKCLLAQWFFIVLIGVLLLKHFLKTVPGAIHSLMLG